MRRSAIAAFALALAAATASVADAAPKLVLRVDKVSAVIVRDHLVVSATGAVRSGGWSMPRLHLKEFHIPESDTEVIEFLASPPAPGAVVIQALLPVTATAVFPLPHYATVQVKVVSETNSVVAPVGRQDNRAELGR
ncbi:MAG TPA: hypothetical protein VJ476_07310 [Rhizomicrobium sp.]|nr:hypothetical protein [Rhizomicrobium sp.]